MIIDCHVHVYDHGSVALRQPAFTVERLLTQMDGPFLVGGVTRRVDMAIAQPHPSDTLRTSDFMEQHRYVADAVGAHPDRIAGCMIFNPFHGMERGLEALRRLATKGFRAVKLHPTMHGYFLDAATDLLAPLMEEAAALGMPVIVHTGDPPHAEPVQAVDLVEAHPATQFVLAHLGTQQVSYAHQAIHVARNHPNVHLEAGWGILPRLKDAVTIVGPDRVLNASDCPIQEMGSQIRLLEVLGWDPPLGVALPPRDVALVLGDNAARLFGLSPR